MKFSVAWVVLVRCLLMLIFKDSILGLVAGVQLSQNDMVRMVRERSRFEDEATILRMVEAPGAIHSGKGLQNKSQFRTIAPKIAPQVLAPRVLPGPVPSLSDQANPGPSLGSKPLGMPPQNYALMQVAGQEGTFSLIALPHVHPAYLTSMQSTS